jgi:chemosensory pili system protein ChpC
MAVDIRSVLIPLTGKRVLLPNATVAEVITYSTPEPVEGTPDWVMGRVVWRGWWVPVFSLPMLGGWTARETEAGAKIAVLKALGGNPDMPFMAMVTQGFPRLVTVTADSLRIVDGDVPDADSSAQGSEEADPAAESLEASDDDIDLSDFSAELEESAIPTEPEVELGTDSDLEDEPEAGAESAPVSDEDEARSGGPVTGGDDGFDPIAAVVVVSGEQAVIPDLVPIERRVAKAMGPDVLKRRR